jgi:hypothetical protein
VKTSKADDWTVERWRTEPRRMELEFSDTLTDPAPPLWKDLSIASIVALLLWGAAFVVFG